MKRWILVLTAVLLMLSLACSAFGKKEPATEEPTTEATEESSTEETGESTAEAGESPSEGTDDSSDDEGVFEADSDALDELDSYRAEMTMRTEKADGTVEEMVMRQDATRDPRAERYSVEGDTGTFEMITIGDKTYMNAGDTWMEMSSEEDSVSDEEFGDFLMSQDDLISGMEDRDYEYLGKETVNGVETKHYRAEYEESWMDSLGDEDTEITGGTVDVWVANERDLPKVVVRFVLVMEGTFNGVEGTSTTTQNVSDMNEPFTIEAPEMSSGLPEGIESYPNATGVTTMEGLTMFESTDTAQTVADFYNGQFEEAGWELSDDSTMEQMVVRTYTKGDESVNLMITSEEGKEGCSVMITWEKPEG